MRLRADVEILNGDLSSTVVDRATGLQLVVSCELARLLTMLTSPANCQDEPGDPALSGVFALLAQLGLSSGSQLEEARERQARYILADAEYSELPRVRATIERAHRETALHREHLGELSARGAWQLSDLPLLTKHDLRRHFPRGLTVDSLELGASLRRGDLVLTSTSGSTGERLQSYSDTRIDRLPQTVLDLWGISKGSSGGPLRTAVLTSPGCAAGVCTRGNASFEERIAFEHTLFLASARDPFDLTREQVALMLDELARFAPDLWVVNPVYLAVFTRIAERWGFALPTPQAIVSTYQAFSVCQQRQFARAYSAPVFEMYSATELGGSQIGVTCRHGALHVRLDHVFLEIVRDGVPVEPGQLGQPVVTTHHPTMPLARYALSDLVRFSLRPCGCEVGSAWPALIVEGREHDTVVGRGEPITSRQVDECLRGLPLWLYQLVETRPGQFRLAVIPDEREPLSSSDVRARLAPLLGAAPLEVCSVSRLPFEESGKFRFVIPWRDESEPGSRRHG